SMTACSSFDSSAPAQVVRVILVLPVLVVPVVLVAWAAGAVVFVGAAAAPVVFVAAGGGMVAVASPPQAVSKGKQSANSAHAVKNRLPFILFLLRGAWGR